MCNGFSLYLDQIHHHMAGRPVKLIIENDESDPGTAVRKLYKFLDEDKVNVISGFLFSHVLYAVTPVAEKYKMPTVDAISGADDVTQRKKSKYVLRTSRSASQASHALGEYVKNKLGYKRVVMIAADYPYGYEVVGGFQQSFEEAGGKVIQKLWAPMGLSDFSYLFKNIRKDADAIFMCTVGPQSEIVYGQYEKSGLKLPLLGTETSFDESFYQHLGNGIVGGISANCYSVALNTPENKKFVQQYMEKYGADPNLYAENSYTAAKWIHKAVESLHGHVEDRDKFLAALRATQLTDDPRGPIKLDAYGNAVQNIYIRKVERVKGKLQNTVIYTYPMVSQFWKYNPEKYMKQPPYSRDYPPCVNCSSR